MQVRRILQTPGLLAFAAAVLLWLLFGPGFRPGPQSAEAALPSEVKKLLASDAQTLDKFGFSVAVSGDTAVVGAWAEDGGQATPSTTPGPPTFSSATISASATGAW